MNSLFEEDILSTERTVIQYAGIGGGLVGSFQSVQAFLKENSHLYHFLHVRLNILRSMLGFRQLAAFDDFLVAMAEYPPEIDQGWALTKSLMLMIRTLAEQHQATFAITIVPNKAQVISNWRYDQWIEDNQFDFQKPIRILQAFGKDQQISTHDFLPDMKKASIQQSPYYNWDGHWNTYGNQAAAESLLRFLIDQKLVPMAVSGP